MRTKSPGPNKLEWFVASRLLGGQKRSYVSLVSSVSMWGLAVGVASLIVIFSVTSGFEEVFREKILGVYPHLVVIGKGGDLPDWRHVRTSLQDADHLTSVTAATYDEMMASRKGRRGGCIVKGVESNAPAIAKTIKPFLIDGRLEGLHIEPTFQLDGNQLHVPELPGGSSYIVVVPRSGELLVEQNISEEETFPQVRILAAADDALAVTFQGLLNEFEFSLPPGSITTFLDLPDESGTLILEGEPFAVEQQSGNVTAILDAAPEPRLQLCPSPPPISSSAPATVCVVNLREQLVSLDTPSGTSTIPPRDTLQLEVVQTTRPGVLLGKELAKRIEAEIGDEVRLVSPLYAVPGMGHSRRSERTIADSFTVVGLLSLGFYEYDSKLAIIDFGAAQRFLHQGDTARWVEVRVDDLFESDARGTQLGRYLAGFSLLDIQERFPALEAKFATAVELPAPDGSRAWFANVESVLRSVKFSNLSGEMALGYRDDYRIITWQEMNKPLFTSMKRQRIVLSLFFLIIIVVAAFNIVSSQIMIVREKQGDIAILKAMGASARQIQKIFLLQGMRVGLLGTALGLVLAFAICGLLIFVGFPLDPQVYFVSKLPVHLRATDILLASGLSLAAIYVAVLVAARTAAGKSPVEGLRELE